MEPGHGQTLDVQTLDVQTVDVRDLQLAELARAVQGALTGGLSAGCGRG
jgi:hypothetical protein